MPAATLRALAGPVILGEEEALEEVVWACLPKITRDIWQHTPHRMYSAEAEVGGSGHDQTSIRCAFCNEMNALLPCRPKMTALIGTMLGNRC